MMAIRHRMEQALGCNSADSLIEQITGAGASFRAFLVRIMRTGKLAAGRIKPLYDAFYA